jgi:hypothetical protein
MKLLAAAPASEDSGGRACRRGDAQLPGRVGRDSVVEAMRNATELAQKILDQMFVFDNLLELDDKAIQLLLREVQSSRSSSR